MSTKNFIDYTHQGDGVNSREALYAAIHDRVAEAINNKKIEIAQNLIGQNESVEELDELSKKTLNNYVKKSSDEDEGGDGGMNRVKSGRESGVRKAAYRSQGFADKKGTDGYRKYKAESVDKEVSDDEVKDAYRQANKAHSDRHPNRYELSDYAKSLALTYAQQQSVKNHGRGFDPISGRLLKKESVNEAREDSPIKGTVKKATYEQGAHKVEVRYDPEWSDYQVHSYKNGKHMGEGPVSYHGDDKQDAHDTAKSTLAHLCKKD